MGKDGKILNSAVVHMEKDGKILNSAVVHMGKDGKILNSAVVHMGKDGKILKLDLIIMLYLCNNKLFSKIKKLLYEAVKLL